MMDVEAAKSELAIFFKRHPDVDWSDGLGDDLLLGLVVEMNRMGEEWEDDSAHAQAALERAFAKLPVASTKTTRH